MVNSVRSLGVSNSRVNEEAGCLSCEMALRECMSGVGAEISMSSLVGQRDQQMAA